MCISAMAASIFGHVSFDFRPCWPLLRPCPRRSAMCHCSCDTLLQLEAPHQLVGFVSVMHLRVEVSDAATSTLPLPETPEAGEDLDDNCCSSVSS